MKLAISRPLRDRLEIIQLSGYSLEEKLSIARKHLIPKQLKFHGMDANQYKISAPVLKALITNYTRETGVRELERVLAKPCVMWRVIILWLNRSQNL